MNAALRKIRKTEGLSVKVAKKCGISKQAVYQWTRVPADKVHKVAAATGIPLNELRPDLFRGVTA